MSKKNQASDPIVPPAAAPEEPPFEQALERLETLVGEMESGSLSLDAMLETYDEGQKLIRFCERKLNEVERRIEILKRDNDGQLVAEPFQVQPDDDAPEADAAGPAAQRT